ncbi:MAG: alpha/beta fold hydrolase [Acidobacteriota bacterium]
MKSTRPAALVGALLVGMAAMLDAQGRRGGAPPGAAAAGPRTGTVEHIVVHGAALERNLEADSPDREVTVYLPPAYAAEPARRFPVVYLLHGYGGRDDTFISRLAKLPELADTLAAAQGFSSPIVVMPNAFTLHKGSMYSSSVTTGDWETFVAQDLVSYIDGHYRTLAVRISRGLAGHSMGGYGALRIAMKRPDVFSSLYVMSACCLAANANPRPESFAASEAIKTRAQAEEAAKAPGFGPSTNLASAAAWSPNPNNPPLFLDLPVKDGKVRPEIVARWIANAPMTMLEQNVATLQKFYAIAIDIGTADTLLASNRRLHEKMTELRIPHFYEEYDGDHTNKVGERLERSVLPFFSKSLASPANPTSPAVQ